MADVDVTLEDDSSTFARALAKRTGGRVRSFPQFLTYKVIAADMPEIDIATARKERYRNPGALPAVTAGKLKDDLLRRDFPQHTFIDAWDDEGIRRLIADVDVAFVPHVDRAMLASAATMMTSQAIP